MPALDAWSLLASSWARPWTTQTLLAVWLIAHVALSAAATALACRALPHRLGAGRRGGFAFFFVIALFMPLGGVLGIAVLVAPALRRARPASTAPPLRITRAAGGTPHPPDMAPLAIEALGRSSAPGDRLRAVMAARQLGDSAAIPLLKAALGDPADEVRLLAHAALGRRERAVYARIQNLDARAGAAEGRARAMIDRQFACEYWELAFLGLVEGEVLRHTLGRARHYAEAALDHLPTDGALHLLVGRICLRDGFLDGAERSLRRAAACGLPPGAVVPWLAETAFRQRRLVDVRELMRALPAGRALVPFAGEWR